MYREFPVLNGVSVELPTQNKIWQNYFCWMQGSFSYFELNISLATFQLIAGIL